MLKALWNNGNPKTLLVSDFQKMGSTEHTTYNKLSYSPAWALIESVDSRSRKLSSRGNKFMKGELEIPKSIIKQEDGKWVSKKKSQLISIKDFQND